MLIGRNPYEISRPNSDSRLSFLSIASQRLPSIFRFNPRKSRRQSGGENLWNQSDAGNGQPPPATSPGIDTEVDLELGPRLEQSKDSHSDPPSFADVSTAASASTKMKTADSVKVDRPAIRLNTRPSTVYSQYSYYDMGSNSDEPLPMPNIVRSQGTNSPVYGLNGIMESTHRSSSLAKTTHDSATSIDDILRKQKELDNHIAALRLFSPTLSSFPGQFEQTLDSGSVSTDSLTLKKADSFSAMSQFSLSIFPEPPDLSRNPSTADQLVLPRKQRLKLQKEERSGPAPIPPPIEIPPLEDGVNGRLPETVGATSRFHKFDSVGTQYDVTSFIGGKTTACILLTVLIEFFLAHRPDGSYKRRADGSDWPDECFQEWSFE